MQVLGGIFFFVGILLVVGGWIIYLLQWLICRKKKSCNKQKCIFRSIYCINPDVSREEEIKLRKLMLEHRIKDKE